jgi:hypothetical protein
VGQEPERTGALEVRPDTLEPVGRLVQRGTVSATNATHLTYDVVRQEK